MKDIQTTCPICEQDVTITVREIELSLQHRGETGGKALVSCSKCCRVMVLPEQVSSEGGKMDLEEWLLQPENVDGDWCPCVRLLDEEQEKEPAGDIDSHGKKLYRPGGAGDPLMKRPYMAKYGINPECMLAKMRANPGVTAGGRKVIS